MSSRHFDIEREYHIRPYTDENEPCQKTFKSDYCALSNRPIFTVFDPAQWKTAGGLLWF